MITAIIPLRLSPDPLYDEIERLDRIILSIPQDVFQILIVDFGTGEARAPELHALKDRHAHVTILRTGDPNEPFSIGAARDFGVRHARTPVVMFHDLDFLCETETYLDIADEASYRELDQQGYDFVCIPTIYLTKEGTDLYLSLHNRDDRRSADRRIHNQALRFNRNELIQHFSLGSSALLINRHFYLTSGGHDPEFKGHGAEDFEFYNRLTDHARRQGRPPKYDNDIPFANGVWEGYRAFFALYGMDIWMRGIALVHLSHPRREDFDQTYKRSSENFALLKQRLQEFKGAKRHLAPLKDPSIDCRTLLLMSPTSMPAQSLRGVLPSLGDYRFIPETGFENAEMLTSYVDDEAIDNLLFLNPYGNPHRLGLFEGARLRGIRSYAFDRGALPDSWFFDDGGFLGRSSKYDQSHWDVAIEPDSFAATCSWIEQIASAGTTLERNGSRRGGDYWRDVLGIGARKIVLVALQRPNDTATRFFAGPSGTYANYLEWLQNLARSIDRRHYVLVVKKHPLEAERPPIDQAIFVPDDANIHDLIEAASCVVVLNSGVGVLALGMNKPVIVCGLAFYANGGLAHQATSSEHLHELVHSGLSSPGDNGIKFIHYLRNEFYSFGASKYFEKKEADGSLTRICNQIDFSRIVNLPGPTVCLGTVPDWISPSSFILRGAKGFRDPVTLQAKPMPVALQSKPAAEPSSAGQAKPIRQRPVDILSQLSLSSLAKRTDRNGIEIGKGPAGHAVFGPYSELDPGRYALRVRGTGGGSARRLFGRESKIVFDIATEGGECILLTKTLSAGAVAGEYDETLRFEIPQKGQAAARKFEFRVWTDGNAKLVLAEVVLNADD